MGGYTRIKHEFSPMRDGVKLCADVFLPFSAPKDGQKVPVICSLGPYRKDVHVSSFGLPQIPIYAEMYKDIKPLGPDACFELCEPLLWDGYAILRVDERSIGNSEGWLDPFGLGRSFKIKADAEGQGYWAAMQKPPHLTCVMSFESACSLYQGGRRGGIYSHNFQTHWYNNIVVTQQRGARDGSRTKEELAADRVDYPRLLAANEYPDQDCVGFLERIRSVSDIEVPIYVAGNRTDPERKFLDYFLFDKKDNGMLDDETSFPPSDAEDVSFDLTPDKQLFLNHPAGQKKKLSYQGYKENMTFTLDSPFADSFEILGSPFLELEVSTSAKDLNLFIYLRAIDENGKTVVLGGNHGEPMDNFARGYFRLSHRDEVAKDFDKGRVIIQPPNPKSEVIPGEIYKVMVPTYPAAYLFDKGQTLSLEIGSVNTPSTIPPMRHERVDRVAERFEGQNVIFSRGRLVLPRVVASRPNPGHA
ncbi:acyl esterase [Fusarium coicis]|nr:acyl esterase [Fusarium coicis]